jgi:hypothetical protein
MGSKKIRKRELGMSGLLLLFMIFLASGMKNDIVTPGRSKDKIVNEERNVNGSYVHITTNDSVHHIVNHPALKGFGRYLLPRDNDTRDYDRPLNQVGSLMCYVSI